VNKTLTAIILPAWHRSDGNRRAGRTYCTAEFEPRLTVPVWRVRRTQSFFSASVRRGPSDRKNLLHSGVRTSSDRPGLTSSAH